MKRLKNYISNKLLNLAGKILPPTETKRIVKVSGIEFKVFESFGLLQFKRSIALQQAFNDIDGGARKEDILMGLNASIQARDSGQSSQADAAIVYLRDMVGLNSLLKVNLSIANIFILLPDEPENETSIKHYEQKLRLAEHDEKIRFFFIKESVLLQQRMAILSKNTSTKDYLSKEKHKAEEVYLTLLGGNMWKP